MKRRALGSRDRSLLREAAEVIGIDEVGRGCLAGPVVVGGAVFRRIPNNPMIQDSKRLTRGQRSAAAAWIRGSCERWIVVEVWLELIDRLNILEATRLAMRSTALALGRPGALAVIDQIDPGPVGIPVEAVCGADSTYFCVAAASILAKVHRDRLMVRLDARYPGWGWNRNRGYGTVRHRGALDARGRSFLHRKSFSWSPVLP